LRAPLIVDASEGQLATVVRWLRKEHLDELSGLSGFYLNRSIIRAACRASEMKCLLVGRWVVGFAIFRIGTGYGAIDILEIRPEFRGRGLGRHLAVHVIQMLFSQGAPLITVECSPPQSEGFWRELGFVDRVGALTAGLHRKLELPRNAASQTNQLLHRA